MPDTATELLEAQERREARDSYRATGGSKRRPLKSFKTNRERKELREAHAARIHAAVAELDDGRGFECWVESLALNPHLSPLNAALVALQSPGEIAATSKAWAAQGYRVGKGEEAAGRITGRNFWPTAYFTAGQAQATDIIEGFEPQLPGRLEAFRKALGAILADGMRPVDALWAVAVELGMREAKDRPPMKADPGPLADLAERRKQIERDRAELDDDVRALVAAKTYPVAEIARAIGVSRQRVYQIAEG